MDRRSDDRRRSSWARDPPAPRNARRPDDTQAGADDPWAPRPSDGDEIWQPDRSFPNLEDDFEAEGSYLAAPDTSYEADDLSSARRVKDTDLATESDELGAGSRFAPPRRSFKTPTIESELLRDSDDSSYEPSRSEDPIPKPWDVLEQRDRERERRRSEKGRGGFFGSRGALGGHDNRGRNSALSTNGQQSGREELSSDGYGDSSEEGEMLSPSGSHAQRAPLKVVDALALFSDSSHLKACAKVYKRFFLSRLNMKRGAQNSARSEQASLSNTVADDGLAPNEIDLLERGRRRLIAFFIGTTAVGSGVGFWIWRRRLRGITMSTSRLAMGALGYLFLISNTAEVYQMRTAAEWCTLPDAPFPAYARRTLFDEAPDIPLVPTFYAHFGDDADTAFLGQDAIYGTPGYAAAKIPFRP